MNPTAIQGCIRPKRPGTVAPPGLWFRALLVTLLVSGLSFSSRADLWCAGYLPGWEQSTLPASSIDYDALTHIIHFALIPNADGTVNSSINGLTPANSADLITRAHGAKRKVLVSVGGAGSQAGYQGATSQAHLASFITNITRFVTSRGYDGVDIDWESLDPSDANQFTNFVIELRAALDQISPRPLMTMAVASPPTPPALIASVQTNFDQINLMTYDLSGPYAGWVTWFNAPIFDGGFHFPSTGELLPSADGMVQMVLNAGVPARKLGIGIAFYGWVWTGGIGTSTGGASLPRQSWTSAPITSQASYNTIMSVYYQEARYKWDTNAQAAYLTYDNPGASSDKFITYDDTRACQAKISFARNRKLGGVMIWELAQDHQPNQPDPLLQAVKKALATPGHAMLQRNGQDIDLSFQTIPLGSYRVLWSRALSLNNWNWNTLIITNEPGAGGVLHVPDPNALDDVSRFYRVQTPP